MSDYDVLQPLCVGSAWAVVKNNILENPILELKYAHHERKKKNFFKEYIVFITVKTQQGDNYNIQYKVLVHIQPYNSEIYLAEYAFCADIENVIEKVKCFAYQYQHYKRETNYRGVPFDYIPIKIPAGWKVVFNSFVKGVVYTFLESPFCSCSNRSILSEKFDWERDISVLKWECVDYEIFVELQEYTNENALASLLYVHAYFNTKDGIILFEELENVFCFSIKEAQEKINQFLWKYKDGLD